jgi:hypothetical protein
LNIQYYYILLPIFRANFALISRWYGEKFRAFCPAISRKPLSAANRTGLVRPRLMPGAALLTGKTRENYKIQITYLIH